MSGDESFAAGLVGIVLDDRYRLDALLGEGGMGAVFRAHHLAMDRKVAVKLLKPHLTSDDTALQRFAREARSTMKVDSDHAVKVLDFGITPHRDYYMVLEYLDGRTVQRELDVDGPFTPERTVHIAKQALHALGAAHAKGLIHRDIKPDNILLMRAGDDPDFAKVLDFGVAKLMDGAASSARSMLALTQTGMVFGTPEFMSPEQACGQSLDPRSDLYSLAATMFAMVTGCGMYDAKSPIEWLTAHARTPPPHLADGLPALAKFTALDQALQKCLAKRREDRPGSADEMIALLAAVEPTLREGGPISIDLEAASTARGRHLRVSPSSYIEALDPDATLVPPSPAPRVSEPTLPPPTQMNPGMATPVPAQRAGNAMLIPPSSSTSSPYAQTMLPMETGIAAPVPPRRRGVVIVIGAAVIAGMIATAIVVASGERGSRGPVVAKQAEHPAVVADAAVAAVAPDGAPPDATVVAENGSAAPGESDASPNAGSSTPLRPTTNASQRARAKAEVAKLLAEAEAAQKAGNRLRQITRADAVLRLDPRNARATLLLADGLIASGDHDRGCKYLHDLGRNAAARARARQAGCSTN